MALLRTGLHIAFATGLVYFQKGQLHLRTELPFVAGLLLAMGLAFWLLNRKTMRVNRLAGEILLQSLGLLHFYAMVQEPLILPVCALVFLLFSVRSSRYNPDQRALAYLACFAGLSFDTTLSLEIWWLAIASLTFLLVDFRSFKEPALTVLLLCALAFFWNDLSVNLFQAAALFLHPAWRSDRHPALAIIFILPAVLLPAFAGIGLAGFLLVQECTFLLLFLRQKRA